MAIAGGAAIVGAATIGSSVVGSKASKDAANTQAQSARDAAAVQQNMFNVTQQNLAPYMQAGGNALNVLQHFLGTGNDPQSPGFGEGVAQFKFDPNTDPEYQWMLSQGLGAITNQASALGGVNSGATLKALSDYGQQSAQSAYQTEFNNWNTTLNNIYARLTGAAQLGQTSAAGVGNAALTTGQSIGSNLIGAGNAQAAGTVGSANAISGGIQSIFNNPAFTQLLNNSGSYGGGAGAGTNALSTSTPQDLIAGYTG